MRLYLQYNEDSVRLSQIKSKGHFILVFFLLMLDRSLLILLGEDI